MIESKQTQKGSSHGYFVSNLWNKLTYNQLHWSNYVKRIPLHGFDDWLMRPVDVDVLGRLQFFLRELHFHSFLIQHSMNLKYGRCGRRFLHFTHTHRENSAHEHVHTCTWYHNRLNLESTYMCLHSLSIVNGIPSSRFLYSCARMHMYMHTSHAVKHTALS